MIGVKTISVYRSPVTLLLESVSCNGSNVFQDNLKCLYFRGYKCLPVFFFFLFLLLKVKVKLTFVRKQLECVK